MYTGDGTLKTAQMERSAHLRLRDEYHSSFVRCARYQSEISSTAPIPNI